MSKILKITKFTKLKYKLTKSQIAILILLNLILVAAIATPVILNYNDNNTDTKAIQTLSKLGSTGSEVRAIQTKLKALGYYTGTVDGVYGTNTRNAVIAFQKNCGITSDGVAGPKTLLYLGITGTSSTAAAPSSTSGYSTNDINLIAKVISAEARGESYTGQVAIGAVILNRVGHSSFPDTIAGVIYQPGAFTCVTDSNWYQPIAASAKKAAIDSINGWDPTGGAIYYYNPAKTTNKWMLSRPVLTTIGSHIFCS